MYKKNGRSLKEASILFCINNSLLSRYTLYQIRKIGSKQLH